MRNLQAVLLTLLTKKETKKYHEVRIVFGRYQRTLSKEILGQLIGRAIQQFITKSLMQQKLITLKQQIFCLQSKPKKELAQYLSLKLSQHFVKGFMVVFDKTVLTNTADFDNTLRNHEEPNTGIVLHALDVSKRDPFSELVVFCFDTDVLLILLHYFDKLSSSTTIKTINREFVLRKIYENFVPHCLKSLLGFHAISGCD